MAATNTTTTTSTLPTLPGPTIVDPPTPAAHVVRWSIQEVGDVTLETVVRCGPDGLDAEYWIEGETVEPETTGVATTALGKIYHRVVAAVDGDDVDYLFDGGWWADDLADGSCEPYELDTITVEPNTWDDYLDGRSIEVTEVLWGQLDLRDIACPYLQPDIRQDAIDRGLDVDLDTCTMDFDHLRRATVRDSKRDRHLLEIGFDCGPFGLGEVWYVIDGFSSPTTTTTHRSSARNSTRSGGSSRCGTGTATRSTTTGHEPWKSTARSTSSTSAGCEST